MKIFQSSLFKLSAVSLVLKVFGAALGFWFNYLVVVKLGAYSAGLFFTSMSIVTLLSVVSTRGLNSSVVRVISSNSGDSATVWRVYSASIKKVSAYSIIFALTLFFVSDYAAVYIFKNVEIAFPLSAIAFALIPYSILKIQGQCFQGAGNPAVAVIVHSVFWPLIACLAISSIVISNPTQVVYIFVVACFLNCLGGCFLWRSVYGVHLKSKNTYDRKALSELWATSNQLIVVSVADAFLNLGGSMFLGIFSTPENVAIYSMALKVAVLTSFILMAVNSVASPKFSALHKLGDSEALNEYVKSTTKLIFIFSFPILLALLIMAEFIMSKFGDDFVGKGYILTILVLGYFSKSITGPVGFLLSMTGNAHILKRNSICAAVLFTAAMLILVPEYGLLGAAIATSLTLWFSNLANARAVHLTLGINIFRCW